MSFKVRLSALIIAGPLLLLLLLAQSHLTTFCHAEPRDEATPISSANGNEHGLANAEPAPTNEKMSNTATEPKDRVPLGVWGGMHIRVSVNNDGADVEYDCAHGTIVGALKVGADGSFSATGTLVQERGGPVRLGEPRDSKPVRYSGRLTGKSMTLTVKYAESSEDYGTYTLTHGSQGRIRKCK